MRNSTPKNNVRWSNMVIDVLGVKISHEDTLEINYTPLLEKSKNVLNNWTNRGLSLMGKVIVINSLVASLFIYKMTVLEKIPEKIVQSFESIISQFIWAGKRAKIALRTLQSAKEIGGLELVDLRKKDIALKCSWVQILHKEKSYAKWVFKMHQMGHEIFLCNLHEEDVIGLGIKSKFWNDVIVAWCKFNYWSDALYISNQYIWLNSRIKVGEAVVFWQDCYNRGLKYIYQLFENGEICSAIKIFHKYGLNFFCYNSLIAAIPKDWKFHFKEISKTAFLPMKPSQYHTLLLNLHPLFFVYKQLNKEPDKILEKKASWAAELGQLIELEYFFNKFKDIYRLTNVNKYRSFQYRMLNGVIITNVKLFQWKVIDTPLCVFCKLEHEKLYHLFLDCKYVQEFWNGVVNFIRQNFQVECMLNYKQIVFNEIADKSKVANFICLVAKQYIYRKRVQNTIPNIVEFERMVIGIENMETFIAIRNGRLNKHRIKWCNKESVMECL